MPAAVNHFSNPVDFQISPEEFTGDEKDFLLQLISGLLPVAGWGPFINALQQKFLSFGLCSDAIVFVYRASRLHVDPQFVKSGSLGENKVPITAQHLKKIFSDSKIKKWLESIRSAEAFTIEQIHRPRAAADLYDFCLRAGFKNIAIIPLNVNEEDSGYLLMFNQRRDISFIQRSPFLNFLGRQLKGILCTITTIEKLQLSKPLKIEDLGDELPDHDQLLNDRYKIIGESDGMKAVFKLVMQVAETSTTVMLLGETGTGKEVFAEAVHRNSSRRERPLIKVNCAALPVELIESELFGHEKGSFTGAFERKIGRFELAHTGSIFLDEIGELPVNVQAKLLRVIQEGEFERIGGKKTLKTNIRIITATNRDLRQEIAAGTFRSDLYFRLNVFPITLPPLRERKDDIPLLVQYFLKKFMPYRPVQVSSNVMKRLIAYNWPGNVRELEHLIERAVLLVKGKVITETCLPASIDAEDQLLVNRDVKTLDEVEREHIIAILKMVNGKISGVGGAAEILQIPTTTLNSKMKRLHIKKSLRSY